MTGATDRDLAMRALRAALPYIRLYKGRIFVVKLGGAICGDGPLLRHVAEQVSILSELGVRVVVVHGGGPRTTALQKTLGIEPRFIDGRRVTCARTLEAAVMAISGSVNSEILAACRAAGLAAVGLSGIDAGLVDARRRPVRTRMTESGTETLDFGEVGDILGIDASVLTRLLDAGFTPVVSPLSCDPDGHILNINADTVAATIAREMRADKLIFLSETPGLLENVADPSTLVSYIEMRDLNAMLDRGVVTGGMLPKIQAAKDALYGGVKRVHMIGRGQDALLLEIFTNEGAGTLLVMEGSEVRPEEHGSPSRLDALCGRAERPLR